MNQIANPPAGAATAPVRTNYRRRWRRVIRRTIRSMVQRDTSMRCAGVAYFGFLSLFPAIASFVLLLGLFADPNFLADTVDRMEGLIPELARQTLAGQLASLIAQPRAGLGVGLAVSLVIAIWSGSRGVAALIFAASQTRQQPETRSLIATIGVSIVATFVGGIGLLVVLALVAGLPAYFATLPFLSAGRELLLLSRWPLLFGLGVVGVAGFYRFAPDHRSKRARWIWPGALIATTLWILACAIFSIYVEQLGNFEATFGSLATAIVLLLWMYNSALILVLGATINAELEKETMAERTAARHALEASKM